MSGDPEQEYFADGMVEEIITALSRIRWLFVIARNSSFTYKGEAVDVKQVGRELGVRYVLEGSVRKGGDRVRITAQLIDAANGAHLWADHFDGSLDDVFDLQDKVASSVAGVIEPTLQAAETVRSAHRPTSDLTAYDLYLRAYAMLMSSARQMPGARIASPKNVTQHATVASSIMLLLPHRRGASESLLSPLKELALLWWTRWSCGRRARVVQAQRQIHRVLRPPTRPPGILSCCLNQWRRPSRSRIPIEGQPLAAIL